MAITTEPMIAPTPVIVNMKPKPPGSSPSSSTANPGSSVKYGIPNRVGTKAITISPSNVRDWNK